MNQIFQGYEEFFNSLKIGNQVKFYHNSKFRTGLVADKYLTEDNVYLDIALDIDIIEKVPFFVNGKSVIEIL